MVYDKISTIGEIILKNNYNSNQICALGGIRLKEQKYILENQGEFKLKDIFECGQCFRWNEQEDGSYIGVFGKNVIQVKQKGRIISFQGICEKEIKQTVEDYFDLKRDYKTLQRKLEKVDKYLKTSIKYGKGIRNDNFFYNFSK